MASINKEIRKGFQGYVDRNGEKISNDHEIMLDRMQKLLQPTKPANPYTNFVYTGSTAYIDPQPSLDKPKNKVIFNIEKIS